MKNIFKADHATIINRLWFLAGLGVFALLFFGLTKEIVNRRQINEQIGDYQSRIAELKIENSALSGKISNWDKSGELELSARIKLGLERPGEQTIVINRVEAKSAVATAVKSNQQVINLAAGDSAEDSQLNAAKWWNYFFNKN